MFIWRLISKTNPEKKSLFCPHETFQLLCYRCDVGMLEMDQTSVYGTFEKYQRTPLRHGTGS